MRELERHSAEQARLQEQAAATQAETERQEQEHTARSRRVGQREGGRKHPAFLPYVGDSAGWELLGGFLASKWRCCTALHCTALHCTALYCIALQVGARRRPRPPVDCGAAAGGAGGQLGAAAGGVRRQHGRGPDRPLAGWVDGWVGGWVWWVGIGSGVEESMR